MFSYGWQFRVRTSWQNTSQHSIVVPRMAFIFGRIYRQLAVGVFVQHVWYVCADCCRSCSHHCALSASSAFPTLPFERKIRIQCFFSGCLVQLSIHILIPWTLLFGRRKYNFVIYSIFCFHFSVVSTLGIGEVWCMGFFCWGVIRLRAWMRFRTEKRRQGAIFWIVVVLSEIGWLWRYLRILIITCFVYSLNKNIVSKEPTKKLTLYGINDYYVVFFCRQPMCIRAHIYVSVLVNGNGIYVENIKRIHYVPTVCSTLAFSYPPDAKSMSAGDSVLWRRLVCA